MYKTFVPAKSDNNSYDLCFKPSYHEPVHFPFFDMNKQTLKIVYLSTFQFSLLDRGNKLNETRMGGAKLFHILQKIPVL